MAREMKESGIAGYHEIPSNWETMKLKNLFDFRKGLSITKENLSESGIRVLSYGQIHSKLNKGTATNVDLFKFVPEEYLHTTPQALVSLGDVIFADTSEDYDGIGNCVYIDCQYDIFAGYHTVIAHPKNNDGHKYYAYLFQTNAWRDQIRSKASGLKVFSITQKLLKETLILMPSTDVQHRIADYLDTKCSEIDAMVEKTKATIEEYKKLKQSIITEAVTKGLDKTVPMKDSGVEWIGAIPEHWGTMKIKYLTSISRGLFSHRPRNDPRYYDGEHPFIQTGDVARAGKYITEFSQTLNENGKAVSKEFPKGTLTMTIAANVGDVAILGFNAFFPDSVVGFIPKNENSTNYLYYIFTSMRVEFIRTAILSTQLNLNIERVKEMLVPFTVNKIEQKEIANYLDQKCQEIDNLIEKKQTIVTELEQYKKSLIYECVTGKREV